MMNTDYEHQRREIESFFKRQNRNDSLRKDEISPSGKYRLTIDSYTTGPKTWNYTRGNVTCLATGNTVAVIRRNYSHFWYAWIEHANGNEYLLCGEDYRGQTVVNLTSGVTHTLSNSDATSDGFCWIAAYPSPDSTILAVDGCHWACPYEVVFYDFSNPDVLPYKEYLRVSDQSGISGWIDKSSFKLTREIEVRKADGKPYEELSDEEQDRLDDGRGLTEYREQALTITKEQLLKAR